MSSPFATQLGTNYCPNDEELAQIKTLLIEPSLQLKHLDDEIASMQKAIEKLTEERESLNAYVTAHKALISPIRRLPLDIIEEIFVACIPMHRNCVMSADEAPIILGRICGSWRTISLSTPRLWSRLHIVEPTRPYSTGSYPSTSGLFAAKVAQRLEVTNTWLRRSGTCPLSISFESNLGDHDMSPPLTGSPSPPSNTNLFLNALVPFARRWQNIRLVTFPFALESFSRLTGEDVPLLEHLKVVHRSDHRDHNSHDQLCFSGILGGSSLLKFSFSGSNIITSDLPLRWGQLTALSLMMLGGWSFEHLTSESVLVILSGCPKLQTCRLLVNDPPEGYLGDSIAECLFLRTFKLRCVGSGSPIYTSGRLLSRLSLPDLRDFTLSGQGEPWTFNAGDSLVAPLAASTRLESIGIDSELFSKSSLMEFFGGLPPTLKRLHIGDLVTMWQPAGVVMAALDDDTLAALSVSPDHPSLCPALQELVISNCRNVSDEALLHFIISRMPALRRVDVNFDREREVDILPDLQSFVDDGLKVSITHISVTPPQFSPWQGLPDPPPGSWGNWQWPSNVPH
ncbi:hypothetical protein B0H13DRAFT_687223 [Mycena leptocephala]|nr:hypothetical protein B0H13DRAFT_687223 [Mycena leptocephala]